jgi:transposase-like protein
MRLEDPLFTSEIRARAALEKARWPDGPVCPHCNAAERIARIDGQSHRDGLLYCNQCKRQFTVTVGTVFQGSKIALTKWLLAIHLMATRAQLSVSEMQRLLGVTYKTAWLMARRLRKGNGEAYLDAAALAEAARVVSAAAPREERGKRPPEQPVVH